MVVSRQSGNSSGERKKDLLCRVKYSNRLPDIPFDPKFLSYPFDAQRFVKYHHTSLERTYKHELHSETDLGLDIDLISMDCDNDPDVSNINEVDEKLLEDEITPTVVDTHKANRPRHQVSWLRKTEYISSDYRQFQNLSLGTENKLGFGTRKKLHGKDLYKDRESQIEAIENTFESCNNSIPNRRNGVYPVEVCPVFPDYDNWKYPFSQVMFDSEPLPAGFDKKELADLEEKMNNAMIRGMMDDEANQFVVYFLPTNETLAKLKTEDKEGIDMLEYKLAREYNWTVSKDESSKGYDEKFFMVWRDGNVYYNELGTKVKLTKRRLKNKKRNKIRLVVKPRELTEDELNQQESRLKVLEKAEVEDEFDEEAETKSRVDEDNTEEDTDKLSPSGSPQENSPERNEEKELASSSSGDELVDETKNIFGSDDDDDDDVL